MNTAAHNTEQSRRSLPKAREYPRQHITSRSVEPGNNGLYSSNFREVLGEHTGKVLSLLKCLLRHFLPGSFIARYIGRTIFMLFLPVKCHSWPCSEASWKLFLTAAKGNPFRGIARTSLWLKIEAAEVIKRLSRVRNKSAVWRLYGESRIENPALNQHLFCYRCQLKQCQIQVMMASLILIFLNLLKMR